MYFVHVFMPQIFRPFWNFTRLRSGLCRSIYLRQCNNHNNKTYECNNLRSVNLLYCLLWMIFTDPTRAEFRLFVCEKCIHPTSNTDTKYGFKKHKDETETTHDKIKHSSNFENIYDKNHSKRHGPAYRPCEAFLRCSSIFRDLGLYRDSPEYHTRSKSWIHEESYREIQEKYDDKDFENFIISDEKSIHKSDYRS
jgi:hypothetical protein